MKTNTDSLTLRRHSIRTLSRGELSIALGGKGNGGTAGQAGPCGTGTTQRTK